MSAPFNRSTSPRSGYSGGSAGGGAPRSQSANSLRFGTTFPMTIDEKYVEQLCSVLMGAIQAILQKNSSVLSFGELYRNAYALVLHKHGDTLYARLKQAITEHIRSKVLPEVLASVNGRFLETLNTLWMEHTVAMAMIRDMLMYMDRVYVQQSNVDSVYNLGLVIFREDVIHFQPVGDTLRNVLLRMIAAERRGETVDRSAIKQVCTMLTALGIDTRRVYETDFEEAFLRASAEYYRAESQQFLAEKNAPVLVRKIEEIIQDERSRVKHYLDKDTGDKILKVISDELITKHVMTVMEAESSGVVNMLNNDRTEDLLRLCQLLKLAPGGLRAMTDCVSRYLRQKGEALVCNVGDMDADSARTPITFIQSLLDLKDRFDHFLVNAFDNEKAFKQKIQSDFEYLINLNPRSPEYLSLFIDDYLKKANRTLTDSEQDRMQEKSMVLFRFLQEKDVFERYYKTHLAKRLLLQRTTADDAERTMVLKLRAECGCQFTSKLEGMFRDMALSNALIAEYKNYKENVDKTRDPVETAVRVLTSGFWPTQSSQPCVLPQVAAQSFESFKKFYLSKHNGRKIVLNPVLGCADLRAIFYNTEPNVDPLWQQQPDVTVREMPTRRREQHKVLTVSTYQMCILMNFNKKPKLTFDELCAETKIPEKELKRSLLPLTTGKPQQRVLIRKGRDSEIEVSDIFWVNDSFASKLTRIRIQNASVRVEPEPERKETRIKCVQVEEDRKHEVEAAVVRIMKARKKLTHNALVTEVTQQLKHRFMPNPLLIKTLIESLIERDYLARDKDDHRTYDYVA